MSKKMLIDAAHAEETRVAVVDGTRVEEFDFESRAKKQLRGNIYLAKVTRVEPSLQAAFVEYGGKRHGLLALNQNHRSQEHTPENQSHRYLHSSPTRRSSDLQHLSRQGPPRGALAPGGFRRVRRQPPRLPRLQRDP